MIMQFLAVGKFYDYTSFQTPRATLKQRAKQLDFLWEVSNST